MCEPSSNLLGSEGPAGAGERRGRRATRQTSELGAGWKVNPRLPPAIRPLPCKWFGREPLHRHQARRSSRRLRDRRRSCSKPLVPQAELLTGRPPHIGTMDVDLGLAIAILVEQRYHELSERLRNAGFQPDTNEAGRTTNQRWRIDSEGRAVTVDFLIPATKEGDKGGGLRNLEDGFAAIITPGLELAFQDRRLMMLAGETLRHEHASREVWVCEAGAFTVLKALAFEGRGENKDAYDLI